jgi:aspartyl-tRNA(Asn)/glutamyl-tRNA(Gln) amidotransferase subunit A
LKVFSIARTGRDIGEHTSCDVGAPQSKYLVRYMTFVRPTGSDPDIATLAQDYRSGRASPVDVVREALRRAERIQPELNAFATLGSQSAIEGARAAERKFVNGETQSLMAGIPVTIKDNLPTAGLRTTYGSLRFADNVPKTDVESVRRLKAAGAIVIGKTTTPEFACRQTTSSALFGITRNPYDPELTPGGSSGGSSASLACGIGNISLVTDGGGSSRLPAACTGIVGFKPTLGRIPYESVQDGFGNFAHLGLMARSVADVALAFNAVAGPYSADPFAVFVPVPESDRARQALDSLCIAWRPRLATELVEPSVFEVCNNAVLAAERAGARVALDDSAIEAPLPIWRVLQHTGWASRFDETAMPLLDPVIREGIRHARGLSAADFQAAMAGRTRLFRKVQGWFEQADVVVHPTLTRAPLRADHPGDGQIEVAGTCAGDIRESWAPMLGLITLTGHPAITIDCGRDDKGMPVGLHLVGRWNEDEKLLSIAASFEGMLKSKTPS